MDYKLSEIAAIVGGKLVGNGDVQVSEATTDSRAVRWPGRSLFVAITTRRDDGHRYVSLCLESGVKAFLVSKSYSLPSVDETVGFVIVPDTLAALQCLAAYHRNRFHIPLVAVTGSNGKTVVKEWLNELLSPDKRVTRSPRSYNSQIGVPLSLLAIDSQTEIAIIEAGISQPNEMKKLLAMIKPTIGVFTHLGEAHEENFVSMKEKCEEKIMLFSSAEFVVYCKDDKLVDITMQQQLSSRVLHAWSVTEVSQSPFSAVFTTKFRDAASRENAGTCITVLRLLGYEDAVIAKRLSDLSPVQMRLEVKPGVRGCLIINDAYNSDLTSIGVALDFLGSEARAKSMRKVVVLSDIEQSGEAPEQLYAKAGEMLRNKGVQQLFAVGPDIYSQCESWSDFLKVSRFKTTQQLVESGELERLSDAAILLKGARSFRFECVDEQISENVHQTTLEVDLGALLRNVDYFRSLLKPTTKLVHMVKANAYGSGDIEVARALQEHGCDYLAVAVADEGARLREEGIRVPIIVMNPEVHSLAKNIEYNLEPEVYNFHMLDAMIEEARRQGVSHYPVHVKINTGMNRLGFDLEDMAEVVKRFKSQSGIAPRSVFSHFVGSDESRFDDFTKEQFRRFNIAADQLQQCQSEHILRHICNSAAIERFPQFQMDMVRLGIGHYGFSPVEGSPLEEVCTLKTTVLQVRPVPASETVSYCRNGVLHRPSRIAAIPVGYADGIDRRLGNGAMTVLVNGVEAPTVGNICMDVCMIDVTGLDVKEGDSVVIFGKQKSVNTIAATLGTISYEVLTGISLRVKRVYYHDS